MFEPLIGQFKPQLEAALASFKSVEDNVRACRGETVAARVDICGLSERLTALETRLESIQLKLDEIAESGGPGKVVVHG